MKRREIIKVLGLSAVAGSVGLLSACTTNTEEKVAAADTLTKPEEEKVELSERDKKIVNRQELSFHDPEKPTDFELKHTPEISVLKKDDKGFTEVKIIVGQKGIIHPTEDNHWIDYLTLWADEKQVAHLEYEAGIASGFASFKIKLDGVKSIKAQIGCNIHGIWSSTIELPTV